MLNLRIAIFYSSHYYIAKMATIAARYSFLRRQFDGPDGSQELSVIHYQMQQYKIIPAIATSWTFLLSAFTAFQQYKAYKDMLAAGDLTKAFDVLTDLHGLVSGLKGVSTWSGEHFGE